MQMCRAIWLSCGSAIRFSRVLGFFSETRPDTSRRHGAGAARTCHSDNQPTQVSRPQTFVLENPVPRSYVAPGKSGTAAPAHSYLDMTGSFRRLDGGTRDRVTKSRHQDPSTFAPAEGDRGLLNGEDD